MRFRSITLLVSASLAACGGSTPAPTQPLPNPDDPAYARSQDEATDPRVSTSAGAEDGVVILYPRIVPGEGRADLADAIQARLVELTRDAMPGRAQDVRPSPERVCPRAGCLGPSVGAVLLQQEQGCAVIVTMGAPGAHEVRLATWAGDVNLRATVVQFREPPESSVQVREMVPCDGLAVALSQGSEGVQTALTDFGSLYDRGE